MTSEEDVCCKTVIGCGRLWQARDPDSFIALGQVRSINLDVFVNGNPIDCSEIRY